MFCIDDSSGESRLSLDLVDGRLEVDVVSLSLSRSDSSAGGAGAGCCSRSIGDNIFNEGTHSVSSTFDAVFFNRRGFRG